MKTGYILLILACLTGCKVGGIGNEGSIMWNLTATDEQEAAHKADQLGAARITCAQGGYEDEGYDACVRNSVNY
ncbi:MAG: hypothetical protein MK052_09095 [Alphaproteobacteria bacterium]|nr:hypothetical protein [Alphaproteobacteria bacterium]